MEYIRIYLGFFENLKTKKLFRLCGHQGVNCLLRLWIYATQNKQDGILDMTVEDIELQVDWRGDPDKFVSGLLESEYLIFNENSYELYGWLENNPHLDPLAVQKRKLRASKGGLARAEKLACKQKESASKQSQAGIKQENCANKLINKEIHIPELKILSMFNRIVNKNVKPTKKTLSTIKSRMREGFKEEDFEKVTIVCNAKWKDHPELKQKLHPQVIFNSEMDKRLLWEVPKQEPERPRRFAK